MVARPRRYPDHRLRGLELDGQILGEAPVRPAKKNMHRRRHRRRLAFQWLAALAVAILAALMLRAAVVEPFSVPSTAMTPTLHAGDRILVVKLGLLEGSIKRGDIVVFHRPTLFPCRAGGLATQDLVKRVIGLPGETISSVGNTIDVDGRPLHEPGWYDSRSRQVGSTPIHRTTVPPGSYFVMGDNRTDSCDSRSFGAISGSSIVGKVKAIITRDGHPYFGIL